MRSQKIGAGDDVADLLDGLGGFRCIVLREIGGSEDGPDLV
jgi:hypothetical protein